MNSISTNIKNLRKSKNLTQQQLADCLGVTHQTVSGWESGRSMPNIDMLTVITDKMDTDINYILYGKKADNKELEKQIKKYFVWFVFCFLFGIATILYQQYRQVHDVNIYIESTIDLRYILPGRIYVPFIRPWVYILPVFLVSSIRKYKGFVRDKAENKIYPLAKKVMIFLLVYCGLAYWWIWGLSPVYNIMNYIPANIRVKIGNSTVFFMSNPAVFPLLALICEVFKPFTNDKTIIPANNPGRNNTIAKNIRKLRTASGLSQQQMAEKLFVTRQTLSNWENGKSMPDVSKLLQICDTMGANFNSILETEFSPGRKIKWNIFVSCLLIAVALGIFVLYEYMWSLATNIAYPPRWMPYSLPILMNLKIIIAYPFLYFALPTLVIQIAKLTGRLNIEKGFKYHKALSLMVVAFLFATVYSYIPEMIKTDIKKAFHTYNPIIWMNYPAFDWLVPMPQMLDYIITDIAVNNKWLYSVLGVIIELSKPNTK